MKIEWEAPLKKGQVANPVLVKRTVALPEGIHMPTIDELQQVFTSGNHSLKTWGRTSGETNGIEPHWIGVCKETVLHTDPKYPRFSHQLVLRVDSFVLRGWNKVETELASGVYFVLDTHSPHQLFAKKDDATWYVAVSMDSKSILRTDEALGKLQAYATQFPFITPEILMPNSGGRKKKNDKHDARNSPENPAD